MSFIKRNKILLFILLIFILITDLFLFINTWNFSIKNPDINFNNTSFYILSAIFFILVIILVSIVNIILVKHQNLIKENSKLAEKLKNIKGEENKEEVVEEIDVKDKISSLLPDDKLESVEKYSEDLLINISKSFEIGVAIQYLKKGKTEEFEPIATYAYYSSDPPQEFKIGEGLLGQVAKDQKMLYIDNLPDDYISIISGLGKSQPKNLLIIPVLHKDQTISVIELAAFKTFTKEELDIFNELSKGITNKLNKFIK